MKILFAVWELDPFIKFGGLGDVASSLPGALKSQGVDVRIILPYYKALKLGRAKRKDVGRIKLKFGGHIERVEVFEVKHPVSKVPVYLLRNAYYLDAATSLNTFAFFDKAIVELIKQNSVSFIPDVIHCNDHHTAFVPLLLKEYKMPQKTVLTIHNLAYQGQAPLKLLKKIGIQRTKCRVVQWEIKSKKINFLTEGIVHADAVTTVSPTYAKEIMTEEFGMGLEHVLKGKEGRVFGILNGIDVTWRNSLHYQVVKHPFKTISKGKVKSILPKPSSWEREKKQNKLYLQKKLKLKVDDSIPLISFIGRLAPRQKGLDILHKMIRRIEEMQYQFIILGTGDVNWEERFQWLATFYPKHVSCNFKFDETLAHQIYAASDFMVIPSKFEPCGLIQMIAMYFGTLPIAHRTGGLKDSVKDGYNGFLFDKYTSLSLRKAVKKAVKMWKKDKKTYRQMVENALKTDFSWDKSAHEYLELYKKLVSGEL